MRKRTTMTSSDYNCHTFRKIRLAEFAPLLFKKCLKNTSNTVSKTTSKILKSELSSIISREWPHGTSMGRYTIMAHGGSPMVRIIQRIRQSSHILTNSESSTCTIKGKRSFRRCLRTSSLDHIKLSSLSQEITRKNNHPEWIPHIFTHGKIHPTSKTKTISLGSREDPFFWWCDGMMKIESGPNGSRENSKIRSESHGSNLPPYIRGSLIIDHPSSPGGTHSRIV